MTGRDFIGCPTGRHTIMREDHHEPSPEVHRRARRGCVGRDERGTLAFDTGYQQGSAGASGQVTGAAGAKPIPKPFQRGGEAVVEGKEKDGFIFIRGDGFEAGWKSS